MGDRTGIAWTDATWNPVRGCSRVSAGCENCYAERQARRGDRPGGPYEGLTRSTSRGPVWSGKIRLVPEALDQPIRWQKPRRIFVNSMSDLFHEDVPFAYVAAVFGVMAFAQEHTFQVLTKRPERMRDFMEWIASDEQNPVKDESVAIAQRCLMAANGVCAALSIVSHIRPAAGARIESMWPLPNVWLGVSVEDQAAADERIPILRQTPAAVRFISAEPLLGRVHIGDELRPSTILHMGADVAGMLRHRSFDGLQHDDGRPMSRADAERELRSLAEQGVDYIPVSPDCEGFSPDSGCPGHANPPIDWVIAGGESGPRARPCDVRWIRSIVEQCREARVPCFVKQLGSLSILQDAEPGWPDGRIFEEVPVGTEQPANYARAGVRVRLGARKGDDPSEWPADLRVQEFPK